MGFSRPFSLYNIRTALLVFVLLPFLLIIVISGGLSLRQLEQAAEAGLEEDIELIARAIRQPLSYALEHNDESILRRTITSAGTIGRVYGVYVYDEDGQRISARGPQEAQVRDIEAATLASRGSERGGFEEVEGEQVFSYFMPLTDSGGRINGLLQITRRGSDFVEQIRTFRTWALSVLAVSALLVLLIVWVGYQRAIGRHIQAMGKSMERIARGNMDLRLQAKGPSEISFLADGINSMLDSILASKQEIDTRREREHQLKNQLHQTEKLAAIGRFAAGVAHELGSPLAVADGKAQRALRQADASQALALQDIRQQLQRMQRIIRQLMDFARPVEPERRTIKIAELVQASLQQVEDERQRQQIEIETRPDNNCPTIFGDRLRLEQALINLLRNAIQAAPGGTVELGWDCPEPHRLRLWVEDNGPGIEEQVRHHLLEPFVTTKPVGVGTGLGLAVVNAVVTEHGGEIRIQSGGSGGARFELCLPFQPEQEEITP